VGLEDPGAKNRQPSGKLPRRMNCLSWDCSFRLSSAKGEGKRFGRKLGNLSTSALDGPSNRVDEGTGLRYGGQENEAGCEIRRRRGTLTAKLEKLPKEFHENERPEIYSRRSAIAGRQGVEHCEEGTRTCAVDSISPKKEKLMTLR